MASPAARLRNNSVLRMNLSPETHTGNDVVSLWFHTHLAAPESGGSLRPLIERANALADGVAATPSAAKALQARRFATRPRYGHLSNISGSASAGDFQQIATK
jgi:hypothetical protein